MSFLSQLTPLIHASYFVAATLFILGLKAMSSPVTARGGIVWAGVGMLLATLATFLTPGMGNFGLMLVAIAIGTVLAWWSGKTVKMTDMPQMIAIYNGMGGGAAAAIAAVEFARGDVHSPAIATLAALGALIGAVSFSGSCVAYAKLQGLMKRTFVLPAQNAVNALLSLATVGVGVAVVLGPPGDLTLPIGGADMPVVISLFNAFTGLAVGLEGYVLGNPALMIAGVVVGAAGTLLTQLMAKAMNRPISNILFVPMQAAGGGEGEEVSGSMKEMSALDAASLMRYAQKVIVVPGYGMAVAHAQHKIWEMTALLEEAGVEVKFAIHPVAGRMPGHMNALLPEAGVPYEKIFDLEEINAEFGTADVALVIGANDVVNPAARTNKASPIYGMPILNADQAQNVIVVKRGQGTGYSGIENALFYGDNTRMLYGNAQPVVSEIIQHVKAMS